MMQKIKNNLINHLRSVVILCVILIGFTGARTTPTREIVTGSSAILHHTIDDDSKLIKKYADLLKLEKNKVARFLNLYRFIDTWMGTPYKWGGCDRRGIDCSCFIMTLFDQVFDINIKRTTFTQFYDNDISLFRNSSSFGLGDLIFFKTNISRETNRNAITHVGMYLANGYFIQSSSSGVNIASLNATYWKNCFVAAGRLKDKYYKSASLSKNAAAVTDTKSSEVAEQQNSDFDPVPYPQDLDELKGKYAQLMGIDSNLIVVPEMFEYIDKLRYAPFNLRKECGQNAASSNCFIQGFFKDVLDINVNSSNQAIASQKQTARLKTNNVPSAFDLMLLKTSKRLKYYDVTGIYLYNGHFVHVQDGEIVISNMKDSLYENGVVSFYRLDQKILKEGADHIDSLRANPELKKAYLDRVNGFTAKPAEEVVAEPEPAAGTKKKKRRKKN